MQTAVPIFCVFIPYFTVITLPFFFIDSTILDTSCTALISLFPTCDAIVIISLMTDYRLAMSPLLFCANFPAVHTLPTRFGHVHSDGDRSNNMPVRWDYRTSSVFSLLSVTMISLDCREGLKTMIVRRKTTVSKVQNTPSVSKFVDSIAVTDIQ